MVRETVYTQISSPVDKYYIPGETLLKSDDSEEEDQTANWVKMKSIEVPRGIEISGFTIDFDLGTDYNGALAQGRIYKNGNAIGTLRENNGYPPGFKTFSEDIEEEFITFDTIELWIKSETTSYPAKCRNFRVYGTIRRYYGYQLPDWG